MRVAIVGSRDYPDLDAVRRLVAALGPDDIVVSGGARGVDKAAAEAATARGLVVVEYNADWDSYGKRAGMIRNRLIVEQADRVVAFWDGESRGTKNTIELAHAAGKPITIVYPS